jgi:uncharacterized protein
MEIKHNQTETRGLFFVEGSTHHLAALEYTMADKLMIINHTEVDDELKGQHVGNQLVDAAIAYARANHLKILPLCPFAHAVMNRRKAELADVLKDNS